MDEVGKKLCFPSLKLLISEYFDKSIMLHLISLNIIELCR